jgi:hypothetical protein
VVVAVVLGVAKALMVEVVEALGDHLHLLLVLELPIKDMTEALVFLLARVLLVVVVAAHRLLVLQGHPQLVEMAVLE